VEPVVSGWVNYVSWLSDDVLLIVGWFHAEGGYPPEVSLILGDLSLSLESRCLSYPRPDLPGVDPRAGKVLTARVLRSEKAREPLGSVVVRTGTTTFTLGPLELSQAMTDLQTLVRGGLAWMDRERRAEVMGFLTSALTEHGRTTNVLRLSRSLSTIRETLVERLPQAKIAPDVLHGVHVDTILAVDEKSFYFRGWARSAEAKITHLTAVSPEGTQTELLEGAFRYPRPDVEQYYGVSPSEQLLAKDGFISYFEAEAPSFPSTGWTIELKNSVGEAVEVMAPPIIRDVVSARDTILMDLIHERPPSEELILNHTYPAIDRLQARLQKMVEVESVSQYGAPSESPEVSIVVPLYQRVDFLEQQMAQFVHDPEIRQAELIYVLDSPELADDLRYAAAQLFPLYHIPFTVVTLERNAGFSAVNNVGASFARGRLLLLLNSDVLPDRPGWLEKMTKFYDSTPEIGALGPKLLYEDDTLQHAGIYFSRLPNSSLWENRHVFKGLHRHMPAATDSRAVPAVSGACLMINADLYKRLGGLRGIYVQGDFEDSDLCLRLIEAGYENWYFADAELYHLEGQSYALASRQLNAQYNTWLNTRLWNEHIEAVMAQYASPTVGGGAVGGVEPRQPRPPVASELAPEQSDSKGDSLARPGDRGHVDPILKERT
jgi:GT2 family glycosyltransferase